MAGRDRQATLRDQVMDFLDAYGRALAAGDLATVAACWETPSLVLSDAGAHGVTAPAEIEAFFGEAVKGYHAQGLVATRPEILRLEPTTERIVTVDVRWAALDSDGAEKSHENSRYILRADDAGAPRIRAVVMLDPVPA